MGTNYGTTLFTLPSKCSLQLNILIEPQASGKSVIAKLLFYFKNFIFEIINAAEYTKSKRDLDRNYAQKFEEYFPSSFWGSKSFRIKDYIDQEFIEIHRKKLTTKKINRTSLNLFGLL